MYPRFPFFRAGSLLFHLLSPRPSLSLLLPFSLTRYISPVSFSLLGLLFAAAAAAAARSLFFTSRFGFHAPRKVDSLLAALRLAGACDFFFSPFPSRARPPSPPTTLFLSSALCASRNTLMSILFPSSAAAAAASLGYLEAYFLSLFLQLASLIILARPTGAGSSHACARAANKVSPSIPSCK